MEGFQVTYWVTFSLLWAMIGASIAVLLFLLLTRWFFWRRVEFTDSSRVLEDPFSGGPRGVDPAVIESFPKFGYSAGQGKKLCHGMLVCVICLGVFKEGEMVRSMPVCQHVFHAHCVDSWLMSHATCPCCRASVVTGGSRSGLLKVLSAGLRL